VGPTFPRSRQAAALLGCLAMLLTGCTRYLDTTEVESELEKGVAQRADGLDVQVDCPDDIEAKQGENFECTATADDGSKAKIEVTQEDDKGNVRWKITELIDEGKA
jgi:Domain of unknown function (DUF4333)